MPFVNMTGWTSQKRMAYFGRQREQYYQGLGLDPDACTMDVTHADAMPPQPDTDARPGPPPPTIFMGADGRPTDYHDWSDGTRNYYIRSTMSAFDQQRLYGTTGFVFKDPAAKYKVQINTLAGRLQYETTKNEELEMARVQNLRRMPHVKDVQAQLEKQRELAAAYSNDISALSGELEQTPIVQQLRTGLSKLRTQMSVLKKKHGALSAKNKELACLTDGTVAKKKKAAFKVLRGSMHPQGHRVMCDKTGKVSKVECKTCKAVFTPSYMKRHFQVRKGG